LIIQNRGALTHIIGKEKLSQPAHYSTIREAVAGNCQVRYPVGPGLSAPVVSLDKKLNLLPLPQPPSCYTGKICIRAWLKSSLLG